MSKTFELLVDATSTYGLVRDYNERLEQQNPRISKKKKAFVSYFALRRAVDQIIGPGGVINNAMISVTRDFSSERQQDFVNALSDPRNEEDKNLAYIVDEVQHDIRPNSGAPLSVNLAVDLGFFLGESLVVVSNDIYLYPGILKVAKHLPPDGKIIIAFMRSHMGPCWDKTDIFGRPADDGSGKIVEGPVVFRDLSPYAASVFNITTSRQQPERIQASVA